MFGTLSFPFWIKRVYIELKLNTPSDLIHLFPFDSAVLNFKKIKNIFELSDINPMIYVI